MPPGRTSAGAVARDLESEHHVVAERPARLLGVHVQKTAVGRAARGDHHVVDRPWQLLEEPLQLHRVVRVEGRGAERIGLLARGDQPFRVPSREDHAGALVTGEPCGREPDTRAPADDDEGLPVQGLVAGAVPRGRLNGHGSSCAAILPRLS